MYVTRPFENRPHEYETFAALVRIVSPQRGADTPAALQQSDADWPADHLLKRFSVYDADGEMVAAGTCYQAYWQRQGAVHLRFDLHPECPQTQILSNLYEAIARFLERRRDPLQILACEAREDDASRVQFLLEKGFRQVMRSPSATLRVAGFDAASFAASAARLAQAAIRVFTLSELYEIDPAWKRKLRDLRWALIQDAPSPQPPVKPTLAEFDDMILQDPALVEEAFFTALAPDGLFVGMSNLWRNDPTGKRLDAGLTGVVRAYRRRGIATALKVRTIQYAQSVGAETIVTSNEENNPMYALNRKLGFEPRPAWISYHKTLASRSVCQDE